MFRAIRRSFTEGIKGMLKNGLMTVTSIFVVTSCIFIFGVFLMITFNINNMTSQMASDYQVDVYVSQPSDGDAAAYDKAKEKVKAEILKVENVDEGTISLVDGKQKFKDYKKELEADDLKSFEGLPEDLIPDAFAVKMKDMTLVDETCAELENFKIKLVSAPNSSHSASLPSVKV